MRGLYQLAKLQNIKNPHIKEIFLTPQIKSAAA